MGLRYLFLSLLKIHTNKHLNGNEIKTFSNKQKLVEFTSFRPVLKGALKWVVKKENFPRCTHNNVWGKEGSWENQIVSI